MFSRHAEQKTTRQVGSIVLPDSATEKIHQGVVIEVGPGARNPFVLHMITLSPIPGLVLFPHSPFSPHVAPTEPRASSSR